MLRPEPRQDRRLPGKRVGAHNIHENEPGPYTAQLQNTVVATWFSAGLRIYDIRDPFRPEEIAAFLPETPAGQRGCRISDVFVDENNVKTPNQINDVISHFGHMDPLIERYPSDDPTRPRQGFQDVEGRR